MTRRRSRCALAAVLFVGTPFSVSANAIPGLDAGPSDADSIVEQVIAEAALRFGLPADWIRAVIRAESGGDALALSRAGAIGLMQLMPGTYAELRSSYGLGADPYQIRDNILAGSAYLRELHNRYGPAGMLAAYNAGPGRWEQHLRTGQPLPHETVRYLAKLGPVVGVAGLDFSVHRSATASVAQGADTLFALRNSASVAARRTILSRPDAVQSAPPRAQAASALFAVVGRTATELRDEVAKSVPSSVLPASAPRVPSSAGAAPPLLPGPLFIRREAGRPAS